MNIHTSLNKFIFFLPNFIFQKAIYTSCILFVFIFCYMHIKLFVVWCSLCSIPFLLRDCKVLCCICGGNNLESNTRKLRTHIYWNNQITYNPHTGNHSFLFSFWFKKINCVLSMYIFPLPDLSWGITIRCSWVWYVGHPSVFFFFLFFCFFFGRGFIPLQDIQLAYSKPSQPGAHKELFLEFFHETKQKTLIKNNFKNSPISFLKIEYSMNYPTSGTPSS